MFRSNIPLSPKPKETAETYQHLKMSSEIGEGQPARLQQMSARPAEPEHLQCPRCDSTNTKFCYYNNYNLSQPRHFCKACRRYWTRGGTLRNIPVGGGTRKSSSHKRSRTAITSTTTESSSSTVSYDPTHGNPVSMIPGIKPEMGSGSGSVSSMCGDMNLNESVSGSFSSLLNTEQGIGFVPLGGFGLGLGSGVHGVGFGLGMFDWPMEHVGNDDGGGGGDGGGTVSGVPSGCNMWQVGGGGGSGSGGGEGGLDSGDCFGWPDLAISTPGKALQ
ncbi:unnamed protein product [Ilex paraguariensis]|uniref:Dof zinc finger protein n=1 Tax=Ilex paraguariensis TaxID=185542 RepID=A0ABC8UA04_9AQUA